MLYEEIDYHIPPPPVKEDYGMEWPRSNTGDATDQITKELAGFRFNGRQPTANSTFKSRFEHGLNLVQMLWPDDVKLYVDYESPVTGETTRIWNNFFIEIFRDLCKYNRVGLTGCASSSKTYTSSVYALLMWMSDPVSEPSDPTTGTTVLISTTAGTDAERRVWGDIKKLHRAAKKHYSIGTLIDYLKVITFDPAKEMEGRTDVSERDIRNGIMVIPVPEGGEGEKALGKIIGTKNGKVVWIVDEMPNMIENVRRPVANLASNIFFQMIGIGNANRKSDPHGLFCEPTEGWESISKSVHTRWMAGNVHVLFLHGERSPNFHDAVPADLSDTEIDKRLLPFPYLSNRIFLNTIAEEFGHGNIEEGKQTLEYARFGEGFWYGDDISQTILSASYVKQHGADSDEYSWGHRPLTVVAGFDPGWTAGGDSCVIEFGTIGHDIHNQVLLAVDSEAKKLTGKSESREAFRTEIAKQLVDECLRRETNPANVFMDINGDGGLMALEIGRVWSERVGYPVSVTGLSSLEQASDDRYHNLVTQYWFQCAKAVATGRVRNFNINGGYAKDLFSRYYESVGRGVIKVESKKEMKKRIIRSPDDGDAFAYMIEGAKRRGFPLKSSKELEKHHNLPDRLEEMFPDSSSQLTEDLEYVSHEDGAGDFVFA